MVGIVECAYELSEPSANWLERLCERARPLLDQGHGVMAWGFDAAGSPNPNARIARVGGRAEFERVPALFIKVMSALPRPIPITTAIPDVLTAWEVVERVGIPSRVWSMLEPEGTGDFIAIVGRSPDGRGIVLGAPQSERTALTPAIRRRWGMVAAHLAAGFRMRAQLASDGALSTEAVLDGDGRCVHAEGAARSDDAREALRHAAMAMDRARGALRDESEDDALAVWKGLTEGRWSLVERFEENGRRYIVAVRNDPALGDPRGLSHRELQVGAYAALGHSTKLIAYELGLGTTAVSFHMKNLLAKLGLSHRAELIRYFGARSAQPSRAPSLHHAKPSNLVT